MTTGSTDDVHPFVLELADPAATDLATTGGKGSSLARLAAAGLPVPGGFHVTTDAYRTAVAGAPQQAIVAAARKVDPDGPATHDAAAARIAEVFAALEIPPAVADAVRAGYANLHTTGEAGDPAVAVRSSATAEDLPGMSFAGQQDTFLNVSGAEALLRAVRDCWASLWTARAIGYRARHGIPTDEVTLAVVVQHLVDADVAGILFTVDPMTGSRDRVLINAAWGLGEAVVGGQVTPDTFTVARNSGAVERTISTKEVRTVRSSDGTRNEPLPAELRDLPSLTDEQATALATLGRRIEELHGAAMDVEWALHDGSPFILQARPVTGAAGRGAGTEGRSDDPPAGSTQRPDVVDEHGEEAPVSGQVRGIPGSAGVVEGVARVVLSVDDAEALRPGEVLVTSITDVAWTPLFPRAAAVVTDIGAPLSHAAIVARELGIPAVVGCGDATRRLRTGDLVRVNGEQGTVEVLESADVGTNER